MPHCGNMSGDSRLGAVLLVARGWWCVLAGLGEADRWQCVRWLHGCEVSLVSSIHPIHSSSLLVSYILTRSFLTIGRDCPIHTYR